MAETFESGVGFPRKTENRFIRHELGETGDGGKGGSWSILTLVNAAKRVRRTRSRDYDTTRVLVRA